MVGSQPGPAPRTRDQRVPGLLPSQLPEALGQQRRQLGHLERHARAHFRLCVHGQRVQCMRVGARVCAVRAQVGKPRHCGAGGPCL